MHPSIVLLGAALASALALARPPDELSLPDRHVRLSEALGERGPPRYLDLPRYLALDEGHRLPQYDGWLTREIERLNYLGDDEELESNYQPMEEVEEPGDERSFYKFLQQRLAAIRGYQAEEPNDEKPKDEVLNFVAQPSTNQTQEEKKMEFALTPFDKGYYDLDIEVAEEPHSQPIMTVRRDPLNEPFTTPRRTRQNPNLRNTKNFISSDVDKFKIGIGSEEGRADRPGHAHNIEAAAPQDPTETIYAVAIVAAAIAAVTVTTFAFAFGWYTMSKKAKAAADVEYPAYGVTGPAADVTGDRKLAQSAHMYHYQHQKQQILAMERSGVEHRDGSVSDPESEEENEEGDYTVYECPGFATTGDMEVKNPMFSDDPTPATPGQCELVKPQPKQ